MLILRTLLFGPAHGYQIAKLHRLESTGWIAAKWEPAGKDLKREFKYCGMPAIRTDLNGLDFGTDGRWISSGGIFILPNTEERFRTGASLRVSGAG